jgi:hypothetical protein
LKKIGWIRKIGIYGAPDAGFVGYLASRMPDTEYPVTRDPEHNGNFKCLVSGRLCSSTTLVLF